MNTARLYTVFVDDNYNYQDESERYTLGEFATFEDAVVACKKIVDEFLLENNRSDMVAERHLFLYKRSGEDPWISGTDMPYHFSAWDYAKKRCDEICGG